MLQDLKRLEEERDRIQHEAQTKEGFFKAKILEMET